jgi:multidrug efflux pump subunit AcrA (membrane-fusion protein)
MGVRSRIPALLLAACLAGCGGLEPDETVPLDQLPEPVMKAAKAALPGVTFTTAWKESAGDGVAYEVRGQNARGRIRDVKVSASGKVLELD